MTDLREAAEQALEALELGDDISAEQMSIALEALRQALAEPANSTTGFVEPVAWIEKDKDYLAVSADPFENAIPVYTARPKREWVGLTVNEARDFYEKHTDREELIYAMDKFLEEKNT